jgi:predicted signal transduction protein with EAL and GGDEF domain
LLIAIAGCFAGFALAARGRRGATPVIAGGLVGLAISAMHYVGMLSIRVDGMVRWQPGMVAASVLMAVVLSSLAMVVVRQQLGAGFARFAPALFMSAIISLHFTGVAGLQVFPFAVAYPKTGFAKDALALATALVGGLIIAAGIFAHAIDQIANRDASARIDAFGLTCEQTGMPTKRAFDSQLAAILNSAAPGQRYIVVTTELRHFNDMAEIYSARAAEFAIRATADRIGRARQPGFVIARTGRSEFTAIGPVEEHENIPVRALNWQKMLAQPVVFEQHEIFLDPRLGVACYPNDGSMADNVVQHSRLALSRAKLDPFEPVCIYDVNFDTIVQRRQILADEMLSSLENGEFELYYQPQVWIADRKVIGYEALIRWNHPRFGLVLPGEFVPLAEATGAIMPIGAWVLKTACMEASNWPADWRVAVNVSPLQLRQADLPERILEALEHSGLSPSRLEIELTESLLIDERAQTQHILSRIRALGVKLALDDFGTGYSSMDVLRHVPFDKIKLDRTFVKDIESNPQALAILHAMVELGRSLTIPILVEGVETERQMAILRAEGCRKVQGYLTGKPIPAREIVLSQASELSGLKLAG